MQTRSKSQKMLDSLKFNLKISDRDGDDEYKPGKSTTKKQCSALQTSIRALPMREAAKQAIQNFAEIVKCDAAVQTDLPSPPPTPSPPSPPPATFTRLRMFLMFLLSFFTIFAIVGSSAGIYTAYQLLNANNNNTTIVAADATERSFNITVTLA